MVHLEAKITVVGDGARRGTFERSVKELGLTGSITFLGQVPHEKLPAIMAAHAIGINYMRPTLVNECRAILKIREYLACGLHVVCNRCGDAPLFVSVAFIEDDIEHMEQRLDALLSHPLEKNFAGREFVLRHFSWSVIMQEYLTMLRKKNILV
jgi:glycosyltransferase involved in cell wall biosynthesis